MSKTRQHMHTVERMHSHAVLHDYLMVCTDEQNLQLHIWLISGGIIHVRTQVLKFRRKTCGQGKSNVIVSQWKLQCPLVVRRTYSLCYVPWCSMIVFLLLTVLMNEGKHVVFRQFVRVDPRLGVVNSDTLLPSPKQPVLMTCTKKQENREKQIKKVMK